MNFSRDNALLFWMLAGRIADAVEALAETGCLARLGEWSDHAELAAATGTTPDGLRAVLCLLVKAGFVEQEGHRYRLAAAAREVEDFIAIEIRLHDMFVKAGGIASGLRGRKHDPLDGILDPSFFRSYARAMRLNARPLALAILRAAGPIEGAQILDLGGADGAVAAELLQRCPGSTATVVDREGMRASCAETAVNAGLETRLRFVAGDIEIPEQYLRSTEANSIFVLSNIAHLIGLPCLREILREIAACAPQGGRVVVYDMFVQESDELRFADLAAMDWVAGGHVLSEPIDDLADWMEGIGFMTQVHRKVPLLPGGMLVGKR
jgi:precorrin-6B methylase 2